MAADIVPRLRDWLDEETPISVIMNEAADTITALRAEVERLKKAITTSIRQHEEGNKGMAHRTLCDAVYGKQA